MLNPNYIKGWLKGYIDIHNIEGNRTAYYIKQKEDILYKICEDYLKQLDIPLSNIDKCIYSFNKEYIKVDQIDKDYYLGYLTIVIDLKFKPYLSYYRSNRLNKEYYLQLITTERSLITNTTKALKVFGIHYRLLFIPQLSPHKHKYRVRISKLNDIKRISQLILYSIDKKDLINKIIED